MINTHLAIAYFKHWLEAVDKHSLQAPFIFTLYNEVIKRDKTETFHKTIEIHRNQLLNDSRVIQLRDLGAGSRASTDQKRSVKSIAASALSSAKFSRLLARLAQNNSPKNIIELGTSFGINTCYLAKSAPNATVYTIDGCDQTVEIAKETFSKLEINNIKSQTGNIDVLLAPLLDSMDSVDFAYLDANHTYEATIRYFNLLLQKSHENTIIVIDDIHWSKGMSQAWKEIVTSNKTTLTIDIFDAGIVFLKPLGTKQQYILEF